MIGRQQRQTFVFVLLTFASMSAFFLSSSRRTSRLVAQALTSSSTASRLTVRPTTAFLAASRSNTFLMQRFKHSTSSSAAAVEEDLDAALDDILGGAFAEASNPVDVEPGTHMKGSRPMPPALVEQDVAYDDPQFLSTSNPRWIQAGLDQAVIDVLSSKGITHFTPVQAEAFDPIMARRDVIGRSRTGTGKTLAFGLPSLTRLVSWLQETGKRDELGRMQRGRSPSMIILCPTRELARQVQEELAQVARPLGLFAEVFHGGVSYDPQARALKQGIDILVGTPGRIIDHLDRGNLNLSECDVVVLDEADEMLQMGFAEDVEVILEGIGSANKEKTQCLLFSATTPAWVKEIGRQYQKDVLHIDSTTDEGGARVAKTVRHVAVQVPPGMDSKTSILEDIIAVEISRDATDYESDDEALKGNLLAKAAADKKKKSAHAMQQKIFGKTIVFTETKRQADELVSGGIFKSLSAQALHGDVGQKQRDATLNAFRAGAFNVLVATDVAARGIDIQDVDLVVQFDPPRDVDTYVHRSGRTGRAGNSGVSVLLFSPQQARDIVRIERDLGHGFKFDLAGPPSTEAALKAAARTSAIASKGIPDDTAKFFKEAAASLLAEGEEAEDVVARCLAAISRRSTEIQSRSLITGELGMATVEMVNVEGRPVAPNDVMFTVGKLSRLSRRDGDLTFDSDVGKIQANRETGTAIFDMGVEDAKRLVEFSASVDAGGARFSLLKELEIERGHDFGRNVDRRGGRGGPGGGRFGGRGPQGGGRSNGRRYESKSFDSRGRRPSNSYEGSGRHEFRGARDGRRQDSRAPSRGGYNARYDSRNNNKNRSSDGGW